MSVETKPNKLVKGLVLDTFHTDVDNTVATYALNAQLEDQEGNHFHYGSEVGTTYIKEIPANHVVVGHINMERNETVLFTTDGTNSTIGILSRNDDMSYQYEIKVDDSKQTKKLGFKKNTYIRGVYRLLNGCDKIIYFVDGINKDRRININQLDSYKTSDIEYIPPVVISEEIIPEIPIVVNNTLQVIVYAISSVTGNIQLIKLLQTNVSAIGSVNAILQSSQQGVVEVDASITATSTTSANVIRIIPIDSIISASANVSGAATIVQYVASSVNAQGISIADALLTKTFTTNVNANATATSAIDVISQGLVTVEASVTATGTATANLLRIATLQSSATTTADTSAIASLTKVLDASATATAQTSSNAQLTLAVNAAATSTAVTSANAQLSYTVNAAADAMAQTSADAFITRIISADATATANSSAEAGIGVTFVAAAVATATSSNATLLRTATIAASVSAAATVSATLTNGDPDSIAFFARVTTAGGSLTSTEQSAVDTLVKSLKLNGIWSSMLAIYPMVGSSAAACRQNLKSSSFTGTFTTGWTFASSGVTGNGTNAYMNTSFNPTNGLSDNNMSMGVYSNVQKVAASVIDMGAIISGLYCTLAIRWNGDILFPDINGYGASVSNATSLGFFQAIRINATQVKAAINGSIATYTASTGVGRPNDNLHLGNPNGGSFYSNKTFAFSFIGLILTDAQATNLYTAVQAFQTSLSRQV